MPVRYVSFDVTVTCRVDAETERCDYGVRGSPVWDEIKPETLSVSCVAIDEVNISLDAMPKDVREYLEEMAAETALADGEWE